jgi:succinate-semialdehyde dehydrogenase / glutarate-semialdehyde dehydrogenase
MNSGERVSTMAIATTNPATGEVIKMFDAMSAREVDVRLERATTAFRSLRTTSFARRAEWMRAAAAILDVDVEDIARTMTLEMGKTLKSARAEVAKCATGCRYFADHAEEMLADEPASPREVGAVKAYVRYQPIGPVLAVMPWNFPLWQAMRFAAPALMAGNVGVLKHSSNVPQTALLLEDLFRRAGFPDGSFQTLLIGSDAVESVIADRRIRAVTLTGSEGAGRSVAAIAGRELKKTVLELGGSDPFVVMPSADIAKAAEIATIARCQNNGQSCIAAKRFIIAEQIADEFEHDFVKRMEALVLGDPLDEATNLGPLATADAVVSLDEDVQKTIKAGARLLTGGKRVDGPGYFYAPTVLTQIPKNSPAYSEELFGPVACIFRARNTDDAIRIANDTRFGLGASAWTNDKKEREQLINEIEAGMVFINGMVSSDPRLPFGGVKQSGHGRELSVYGIREFTNIKAVWVREG